MAFYDLLHKFHYIEANNLKALLPGFVVAQMEVDENALNALCVNLGTAEEPKWYMENGTICSISENGICEWAEGKPMFIAYNDPLNTIVNDDVYYATELNSENPRLVQLIPGDEWMADGVVADHKGLQAAITAGLIKVVDENSKQSADDWFGMHTMPNGEDGIHLLFVGK